MRKRRGVGDRRKKRQKEKKFQQMNGRIGCVTEGEGRQCGGKKKALPRECEKGIITNQKKKGRGNGTMKT